MLCSYNWSTNINLRELVNIDMTKFIDVHTTPRNDFFANKNSKWLVRSDYEIIFSLIYNVNIYHKSTKGSDRVQLLPQTTGFCSLLSLHYHLLVRRLQVQNHHRSHQRHNSSVNVTKSKSIMDKTCAEYGQTFIILLIFILL